MKRDNGDANGTVVDPEAPLREFSELQSSKLLWWINRSLLHPRGFALGLTFDKETHVCLGWTLLGDGLEPWTFADTSDEKELLATINELLKPHTETT